MTHKETSGKSFDCVQNIIILQYGMWSGTECVSNDMKTFAYLPYSQLSCCFSAPHKLQRNLESPVLVLQKVHCKLNRKKMFLVAVKIRKMTLHTEELGFLPIINWLFIVTIGKKYSDSKKANMQPRCGIEICLHLYLWPWMLFLPGSWNRSPENSKEEESAISL